MTLFGKRSQEEDAERLRNGLLWVLEAWTQTVPEKQRTRLTRLQNRLERSPSPIGLMKDLGFLVPHDSEDRVLAEAPSPEAAVYGDSLISMAAAMRETSLIDHSLQGAIDLLARSMPISPDRKDALRIARDAEAIKELAAPVRVRTIAERNELSRTIEALTDAIGDSSGSSDQLISGLDQLAGNLQQEQDPSGFRQLREATLKHVAELQQEAEGLRNQLSQVEKESGSLREIIVRQSEMLIEVNEQATRDALTGLLNRGAFDTLFVEKVASSRRNREPISLVLLDVDHFKRVNDTFGHPAGDQVLRVIGDRLRRLLRDGDIIARVGGEEFAAVLPRADTEQAAIAAERIRVDLERQSFSSEGAVFRITLSLGVDALTGNEDSARLYARVDKALYAAKQGGRNRVMVAA
ncbi:MAG: diguanylate cyclase (GGDEF)-like protein [Myxococcota bacterium]|jgi:diguanylate cyclase (GGDEF)-like protein